MQWMKDDRHSLGDPGGVHEDVESSVVVHYIADRLPDSITIPHIDAIEASVDAGLGGELASRLVADVCLYVQDCNPAHSNFCKALGYIQT